jgi:transposase InsO family protein
VGLGCLCRLFGYTRQAFYQQRVRNVHQSIKEEIILEKVKDKRIDMPRIGGRKLLYLLKKDGLNIGRDRLFDILQHENMLVKKRKRRVFTTQSKHWLKKYPNLIAGMEATKPNKLWVADITYIVIDKGFAYLFLITDAYSRKIVGYYLSHTLESDGGIEALKMALSEVSWHERIGLIHHSDRGVQYCSHNYVNLLLTCKMLISMTENGDPYENALAERVNGILKSEWIHCERYSDFNHADKRIAEIVSIYNSSRPHMSCGMLTPNEAHEQSGKLKKHWKNYYKKAQEKVGVIEEKYESVNK